jgi:hypothetical protein
VEDEQQVMMVCVWVLERVVRQKLLALNSEEAVHLVAKQKRFSSDSLVLLVFLV